MPRPTNHSNSPLAEVRRHFGLSQATLAAWLGIGAGMVGHLEAGRKPIPGPVLLRLAPLAAQVGGAVPPPPPDPAAALALPDAGPLAARRDYCQHHAARLRRALRPLAAAAQYATRWQAALPALLAAAPAGSPARAWLLRRQEAAAEALDGAASAQWHLLRLQAEGLEAEAAALTALLGDAVGA